MNMGVEHCLPAQTNPPEALSEFDRFYEGIT